MARTLQVVPDHPFLLKWEGEEVWKAIVDNQVIPAEFNSKGAALVAIPVEKHRRAKKLPPKL